MKGRYCLTSVILLFLLIVLLLPACGESEPAPAAAPAPAATTEPAKQIVMTWAHANPPGSAPAVAWEWWATEIEKQSNGRVKIDMFPGGSLFEINEAYPSLVNKVADFTCVSTKREAQRFPLLVAHRLPTVSFPNNAEGQIACMEACETMAKEFPAEAERQFGEIEILLYMALSGYTMHSQKEIRQPNDLKGVKVACDPALGAMFEQCGGAGVNVISPDVYMSLRTGVIDATVAGYSMVYDHKLWEVTKYSYDYVFSRGMLLGAMNKDTWNSLPGDIQKLILDIAPKAMKLYTEETDKGEIKGIQGIKDSGNPIITPTKQEIALWQAAGGSIDTDWVAACKNAGYANPEKYLERFKQLAAESW